MTAEEIIQHDPASIFYDEIHRLYIVERKGWIERRNIDTGEPERHLVAITRHGCYTHAENAREKAERINAETQP